MELVDGLDVAEDGGDEVGGEHVLGPVLLVHAEVENLQQRISFISEVFRTENLFSIIVIQSVVHQSSLFIYINLI